MCIRYPIAHNGEQECEEEEGQTGEETCGRSGMRRLSFNVEGETTDPRKDRKSLAHQSDENIEGET